MAGSACKNYPLDIHMSRLNDHAQKLKAQWRQLSIVWENTGSKWCDQARTDFEHQHWRGIEEQIKSYTKALDALCDGSNDQDA